MDVKTMATLAVTLAVAILGYLAKYFNDTAVASMEARLDRTTRNYATSMARSSRWPKTQKCRVSSAFQGGR